MAQLFKTDKVNGHVHVVYIRNDGTGTTDSFHHEPHEVTGIRAEGPDGVTFDGLEMSSVDGHDHTILPFEPTKKKGEKTKPERVISLWKEFKHNEQDSREKAHESWEFMMNKQWDENDESALDAEQRSHLTLNHTAPNIRLLSGHQRQNRTDIRYFPVEEGDGRVADMLTALVKNITEQTDYPFEETLVFEDQTVAGRGVFHIRIDKSSGRIDETGSIEGDIVVEKFPWDEIYFGPHEKFDLSDCEAIIKSKFFSKDKIKQLWPNKSKDIQRSFEASEALAGSGKTKKHLRVEGEQYLVKQGTTFNIHPADSDLVNLKRKEFRVMELNEKIFESVTILFDPINDFFFNAERNGLKSKDIEFAKTIPDLNFAPQKTHRIKKTVVAGSVLLEEELLGEDDLPDNEFDVIPVYAVKKGSTFQGKVEDVKDSQREINKRHSQMADILNRHASYTWFYDNNTFDNQQDARDFDDNISKSGSRLKIKDVNRPPIQKEGAKFPAELASFANIEQEQLQLLMNINPELRGFQGGAESGIAIVEKNRQGLLGNEFLFDNLSFGKKVLGRKLIKYIQRHYTPRRILRTLMSKAQREAVDIGGQNLQEIMALPENEAQEALATIEELLRTADLSKFDVAVGESAFTVTNRRANFLIWSQMAAQGFPVPPELLVKLSDLPDKEKVMGRINEIQQQQASEQQADRDTEILKTQIAADSRQKESASPDVSLSIGGELPQ
jgi:hypothetical protein